MKRRATSQHAPTIIGAYATRRVSVSASSHFETPQVIASDVEAVVTTDTDILDEHCVGIEIEIRRPGHNRPRRVSLDVPASELHVVVTALAKAVAMAHETGVIAEPLARCAAADKGGV